MEIGPCHERQGYNKFTGRVGVDERAIATGVELSIRNNVLLLSSMRYKAKEWEKSPGRSIEWFTKG